MKREYSLLLGRDMLSEDFYTVLRLELADKTRVPEFACHAEVLATAHQSVALTRLCCRGDSIGIEVLLLSTGDCDKPSKKSAQSEKRKSTA